MTDYCGYSDSDSVDKSKNTTHFFNKNAKWNNYIFFSHNCHILIKTEFSLNKEVQYFKHKLLENTLYITTKNVQTIEELVSAVQGHAVSGVLRMRHL